MILFCWYRTVSVRAKEEKLREMSGNETMQVEEELVDIFCDPARPVAIQFQDVSAAAFKIKSGIERTPCNVRWFTMFWYSNNSLSKKIFIILNTSMGGEIAQSLKSLSTKRAIRDCAWLDPLVLERWNSITVLLTCSQQCRRLVKKRQSMCYYVCNDACKRSLAICRKSRALCPVSRLLSVPIWPACVKQGR